MIRAENIFKSFGEQEVLKGIDFTFESGKSNLIIGKSGAGKTVLLKILVGLIEATKGHVWYGDEDLCSLSNTELLQLRMKVGMLFQGNALFDSMTVEENVAFPLMMFTNMSEEERIERANVCLERVDIINKNKLLPAECSGGMQKRIAIARAIAMNPRYLFCDEPNSGLDPKTSIVIDNLIKEITYEYDITTIVITHDMNSVIEIGDNIMFIYGGKKWWEGNNKEIIKTDNQEVVDFVYASTFMRDLRDKMING